MNEAEKLLEKFARKNMVQWDQESFKRTHSRLHKSIIEALTEALLIHDVVERNEQLKCPCCGSEEIQIHQDCSTCDKCKNLF